MGPANKFMRKSLGFTVVEMLVAVGISSIVLLGTATLLTNELSPKKNTETFFWLSQLRSEIVSNLKKKPVFEAVILNPSNPSLSCLKPKVSGGGTVSLDCRGAGGEILVLKDVNGNALIENTSSTKGFNKVGQPCNEFSDSSETCQFQIKLSWEPICPSAGKCLNPDLKIEGRFIVSKAFKQPLNPDLYGFRWVMATTEKAETVCDTSGIGTSSGSDCKMNIETKCSTGEFLVGFNQNGSPICRVLSEQRCTGSLLQGFNAVGKSVCGPLCQ